MIRHCTDADLATIDDIINDAAEAYRGVIPTDCWHKPYMLRSDLVAEIAAGVAFSGWEEANTLLGVMGLQKVRPSIASERKPRRPSVSVRRFYQLCP